MIISLVGGGGKTTTMFYIGRYFAKEGKNVIVTTTTHIVKPENYMDIDSAKELKNITFGEEPVVIGKDIGEKLSSPDIKEVEAFDKYADIVLVEADGAKRLPIKLPRDGEPVLPEKTDICIVCMGIDAVGEKISEKCFRYEIAKELFGWNKDHVLSTEDAARILTDKRAGFKGINNNKCVFVINKVDGEEDMKKALEVENYIKFFCKENGFDNFRVSITSYRENREFCDFDFL
jgi:probable selenium-dependent hydroxylase accessory protein yqeC